MTSNASPASTRKSSWSASQWYIAIGSPGPKTPKLILPFENPGSPPNTQNAGRPPPEADRGSPLLVSPPRGARVEDEPARPLRKEPFVRRLQRRLGNHRRGDPDAFLCAAQRTRERAGLPSPPLLPPSPLLCRRELRPPALPDRDAHAKADRQHQGEAKAGHRV